MSNEKAESNRPIDLPRPAGWAWTTVETVGDVTLGRQRSPKNHDGPNMRPYLRVANVYEDRLELSDVMSMNFASDEFERFKLRYGDVLLNEGQSKELVGRAAIFRDELVDVCFTNTLVRFRCSDVVKPEYALTVFRCYLHNGEFQKIARWTTNIAHLGAQRFATMTFPLAPIKEQGRIVEEVASYETRLDDAVASLERVERNLKRYRASVLKSAVEGRLVATEAELAKQEGRDYEPADVLLQRILKERRHRWEEAELAKLHIQGRPPKDEKWLRRYNEPVPPITDGLPKLPPGWCWASMDQLTHYTIDYRGKTPPESPTGIPIISAQNVKSGRLVFNKPRFISEETYEQHAVRGYPHPGDLIVTTEAPVGEVALYPESGTYQLTRRVIGFQTGIHNAYLSYCFRSDVVMRHLKAHNRGTTVPRILKPALMGAPIPLPPEAEQSRIVQKVERHLSVAEASEKALRLSIRKNSRVRQAILKWAFEGKLADQDPNDERASVLLQRIKVERETAKPEKKSIRQKGGGKKVIHA